MMRLLARLCLLLALGVPASAPAQDAGVTLDEAVKNIKAERDVRVLSAKTVVVDGERMHRIKVLTPNGRVRYIWVEPGGSQ